MPGLSTDEVFGPAPKAAAKPAGKSQALSTEDVFGAPAAGEGEDLLSSVGSQLKRGGKNVAAVADMVLGLPGQALSVGADIGGRTSALLRGGSRSDQEWAGKAMQGLVPESLLSPISSALKAFGLEGTEDSDVTQLMTKAMGLVSRGGEWVEEKTGRILTKADVESLVNTTLLGLGGRGSAAVVDPKLKAMARWKEDPAALKARLEAKVALDAELEAKKAAEAPIETPTGRMIPRTDTPPAMRSMTREEMAQLEKTEKKALEQKRKDVRAAFADDPAYADRLQGEADLADQARELEGRHTNPDNLPPNMTRTRAPELTAADEAPKTLKQNEFGDLSIEAPSALESGLDKIKRDRAFDLTAEELAAVNASKSEFNRPEILDAEGKPFTMKGGKEAGAVDPELLQKVSVIGGGAALAAYLSGKDEDGNSNAMKNAALTAAVLGLGMYAKSRSPAVRDLAESAGRGAEYGLGLVSTRVGNMSKALLHRMREHERGVLTSTHDNLNTVAPFLERLSAVPDSAKAELNAAILTNDNAAVLKAMGKLGDPELVREWKNVRAKLDELGKGLLSTGRLKELLPDYYPRVVEDLPGLLQALGTEQRSFLEKKLETARIAAMRESGRDLSPLEQSLIVNKVLRSKPTSGKPGYLKSRVVEEVSPELAKFYAPAEESLPLYIRAVSRELERAKFFGDDLVRDPEGGLANIDLSIGNVVNKARLEKKLTEPQVEELRSILQSRFGPGERASSGPIQAIKNLTNVGLLGNITSSVVQAGDVAIAVAQQGFLPTVKALQQIVTNDPAKITMKDLGLINHITEEVTGGAKNVMKVGGVQISSAKFLDKVFKYSGFSAIDQLGKSTAMNAAANRFRRLSQTESGRKVIERKYGEAYGEDFPALVKDLQSGALTDNVKGLLFSELSDIQPITKLEVPQAYLDHPNGRAVYMLKTYMLKQADIIRREGIQEIKAGNVSRGTQNIMRYAVALGLAGATTDFIKNWILGRENNEVDWSSVTENMFKTFGWSQYVTDQVRKGKPLQAIGGTILPPYKMWDEIISRDPKAINYLPFFGRIIYAREMGGSEKADRAAEKRKEKEDSQ